MNRRPSMRKFFAFTIATALVVAASIEPTNAGSIAVVTSGKYGECMNRKKTVMCACKDKLCAQRSASVRIAR